MWHIWIDTGGTFTDCLALTPSQDLLRTKVLSSSFLRGRIEKKVASSQIQISSTWTFPPELIIGFSFRIIGQADFVNIRAVEGNLLTLSHDLFWEGDAVDFEITTHEEAPVLATRIVTQTALNALFPPLSMRLGTTKGTNALLERKGAKVTLFVTKGFKDLLRIGTQQRPNLFQIAIPDPTLLYHQVVEIEERLDASGTEIAPITLPKSTQDTSESIAISFLNSYRNPAHEQAIQHHFLAQGHRYVSTSTNLYAGINYLKRTQTTLVNAYLQPILSDYLNNIIASFHQENGHHSNQTIKVMTSAGGLVSAESFQAKDSLLSGPAGGMVGAAAIAKRLGFERCLTFDMGGTSTDTARFDGKLD